MADDNLTNDQPEELTVSEAAGAIEALLSAQGGSSEPSQDSEQPQDSPKAAAPQQAETGNTEDEPAQAATSDNPAPVATPEPAKAEPSSDVEALRQEAARKVQEADTARNQYLTQLNTLIPQMEAAIKGEFADIKSKEDLYALADPRSEKYNVERYNAAIIAFSKLNDAVSARDAAQQDQQKVQAERLQEWRKAEQEKIAKLIPELSDPDKGPVLAKKLGEFAKKQGYSAQQLSLASASDFAMLHKAMQFENLQAAQAAAKAKAAKAPPVQQPGVQRPNAGKDDKIRADYERLQKSGRVDDAAAVFRNFLN